MLDRSVKKEQRRKEFIVLLTKVLCFLSQIHSKIS